MHTLTLSCEELRALHTAIIGGYPHLVHFNRAMRKIGEALAGE